MTECPRPERSESYRLRDKRKACVEKMKAG